MKRQTEFSKFKNIWKNMRRQNKKEKEVVKFVFVIKRLKVIPWFLLAIAREVVEWYTWVVSKHGSIAKLKNKLKELPKVITSQNLNVRFVNALFLRLSTTTKKMFRWWPFLNQTNLTLFYRALTTSKKINRKDASISFRLNKKFP